MKRQKQPVASFNHPTALQKDLLRMSMDFDDEDFDEDEQQQLYITEQEREEMRKRDIVRRTHKLYNQNVLKLKIKKKGNEIEGQEGNHNYMFFDGNEQSETDFFTKKKKKTRSKNPLSVFKKHQMPIFESSNKLKPQTDQDEQNNQTEQVDPNLPQRLESRNIYDLVKLPRINVPDEDGDIRFKNKNCEPYLRQIIFDHNQIKKRESNPQFDREMMQYRVYNAEYKQRIDELDEINRLAALNRFGAYSGPSWKLPQYNLHTVKYYPPQEQAENMFRNYIPASQLMTNKYENPYLEKESSLPRFRPLKPLGFF